MQEAFRDVPLFQQAVKAGENILRDRFHGMHTSGAMIDSIVNIVHLSSAKVAFWVAPRKMPVLAQRELDFTPFEIVYLKWAKSPVHAEPKQ